MAFTLTSSAFANDDFIPAKYTCEGEDISPPLKWQDAPQGTQSFVLIMDDPDAPAGVWDHWILFNIPTHVHTLMEGVQKFSDGTQIALNSWQRAQYNGPCPPRSHGIHRYVFKLYALNSKLDINPNVTKSELQAKIKNHLLDVAEYHGKYERKG